MKGFEERGDRLLLCWDGPFDLWFTLNRSLPPDHSLSQVHGTTVVCSDRLGHPKPRADGLWLRPEDRDGPWALWFADCAPVAIGHPSGHVALLHCGFHGTRLGIVEQLARLWRQAGLNLGECTAWIGPCAGFSNYSRHIEGDPATRHAMKCFTSRAMRRRDNLIYFDLQSELASQLQRSGVESKCLFTLEEDTVSMSDRWFSHRRGDQGRHALVASRR